MLRKKQSGFGFTPSNETHYNRGSFRDFLKDQVGAVMHDPRQRMLQHDNTYFGFVAAPSVQAMEEVGEILRVASLKDLYGAVGGSSVVGTKEIQDTGCYFLKEEEMADGVVLATAKTGDYLGFISIRDPAVKRGVYSLGRTSIANGEPIFTGSNDGPVLIDEKCVVDVIPGRVHLGRDGTDLQSLKINDKNASDIDISLKLTGPYRRKASQPRVATRGFSNDQTFHSDYVAGMRDWRDSDNPIHHYDLDARIIGTS